MNAYLVDQVEEYSGWGTLKSALIFAANEKDAISLYPELERNKQYELKTRLVREDIRNVKKEKFVELYIMNFNVKSKK